MEEGPAQEEDLEKCDAIDLPVLKRQDTPMPEKFDELGHLEEVGEDNTEEDVIETD